jgi:hypothetical protein
MYDSFSEGSVYYGRALMAATAIVVLTALLRLI